MLFQMLFLSYDTDRSGKMSSYELRIALKAAGENSPDVVKGYGLSYYVRQLECLRPTSRQNKALTSERIQ